MDRRKLNWLLRLWKQMPLRNDRVDFYGLRCFTWLVLETRVNGLTSWHRNINRIYLSIGDLFVFAWKMFALCLRRFSEWLEWMWVVGVRSYIRDFLDGEDYQRISFYSQNRNFSRIVEEINYATWVVDTFHQRTTKFYDTTNQQLQHILIVKLLKTKNFVSERKMLYSCRRKQYKKQFSCY